MTNFRSIACATLAGLSGALVALPVSAQQAAPMAFSLETGSGASDGAVAGPTPGTLATLPATVEELTFTGEAARRQFAVYVLPLETTKPARLVLSYQSTVSIMPESSLMRIFVNDLQVGETRLGIGGQETIALDLAPGTLQPGFNQVRIAVDQHHRVDCSIAGTYELWTAIDPARSGLSFEGGTSAIQGLEDMPALSRFDLDGITAVHATLPAGHSAKDVDRAMSAIQSAVLIGNLANPRVSFDADAAGAALEVVATTQARLGNADPNLMVGNTQIPAVTFEPRTETSPARLMIVGTTQDELDRALANLSKAAREHKAAGTAAGLRALVDAKGLVLSGGQDVTLRDLGMSSRQFTGRFYLDSASFRLPSDFYPADYADAELTLNAGYAAGLARNAQLVVRANGRVVSTISLSSSKPGLIKGQKLRVPLGALQPGKNTLTFEASLANDSDAACDPAVQANPPARLFISDTSSLSMPNFARIGHVPELSAMASGGPGAGNERGGRSLSVLTKTLEPSNIDVAATFVSKMAISAGTTFETRFLTSMPYDATGDLIAFGTYGDLPSELMQAVRLAPPDSVTAAATARDTGLVVGSAQAGEIVGDWETVLSGADGDPSVVDAGIHATTSSALAGFQSLVGAFSEPQDMGDRLAAFGKTATNAALSLVGLGENALAEKADPSTFHRPSSDASLVIAQGHGPASAGAAWTVVAANDRGRLASDVALLTSTARWDGLGGAVASLRGETGTLSTVSGGDEQLFETQPRSISNLRLVVAGWFSRHLESYVLALLLACLVLGTTTFLFLRSVGEKRR